MTLGKLRRHAQLAPQDPDVRYLLATELARHNCYGDAIDELHEVIRLAPNHLEARKLLETLAGASR
jgi:cytochrome c-type biogenesis protein CcmH/NrfG